MNLRAVRTKRQMTRAELAERAGISPWTIRAIEVRGVEPKIATVRALARALGVSAEKLLAAY
jgi:DNA-binding XRE family transcriptional regulator